MLSKIGNRFSSNNVVINEGNIITIDGSEGKVYKGSVLLIEPKLGGGIAKIMKWVHKYGRLGIMANADTPEMVKKVIEGGAEGIGLARTERMFNSKDRLELIRKMVLASSDEEKHKYLEMIKPLQKNDFKEMFKLAAGKPITISLIDMPLHEFLPKLEELIHEVDELRCEKKEEEAKEKRKDNKQSDGAKRR